MELESDDRHWRTIEISARDFQNRVHEIAADSSKVTSVYSRLALVHQVAKACAREQAIREGFPESTVEIEELTDPPLSDDVVTDEPVLIRFSYSH